MSKIFTHPFYQEVKAMGETVALEWKKSKNNFRQFSKISFDVLNNSSIDKLFDLNFLHELKNCRDQLLPQLHYHQFKFSDFPITIMRFDDFFIDLYIWENFYTDTHDHHFSGAFKVIHGRGLNLEYNFELEKDLSPFLQKGLLTLVSKREQMPGDTFEIRFGGEFIHQSLHNLGEMKVTLCIRTENLPNFRVSEYFIGGHKFMHFYTSQEKLKLLNDIKSACQSGQIKKMNQLLVLMDDHFKAFVLKDYYYSFQDVSEQIIKQIRSDIIKSFGSDNKYLQCFYDDAKASAVYFHKLIHLLDG